MSAPFSQEVLNAFIDGELQPSEAAKITEALSHDPALGQRIAHLHRLKAALSELCEEATVPPSPSTKRLGSVLRVAAVGMIAGLLFLGGPFWTNVEAPSHDQPALVVADPFGAHDDWARTTVAPALQEHPDGLGWVAGITQASGLELVHSTMWENGLHLGYLGRNSCRLSLFIVPVGGNDTMLDMHLDDHQQQARWVAAGLRFDLIAYGMDTARFATIATTAHQKSRDHLPASAAQIALINAARLPCTA